MKKKNKGENKQSELFNADVSWFHIFKELVRSGSWAKMSANAKAVYPVIKAFINWESGTAFPSVDTLQKYSGLSKPSVLKALKELEGLGLLKREGRERVRGHYTLMEKFDVRDQEGRPTASVTFDYLPAYVGDAVAELKNFLVQGMETEGKFQYIKIENLTLNIIHGSQFNANDPESRKAFIQGMRDILAGKKTEEVKALVRLMEANQKH